MDYNLCNLNIILWFIESGKVKMRMRMRKTIAAVLALTLIMAGFTGCGSSGKETEEKALIIAQTDFSQCFSPFFARSTTDRELTQQTQIYLVNKDREGNVIMKGTKGEVIPFEKKDYTYYTPCDISTAERGDGTMDITFKLRNDILFSDGVPMTADDIIFSLYVFSDPSYDGEEVVYALPIEGMESYRASADTGVSRISGIEKTGDYTVKIHALTTEPAILSNLDVAIAPLHYYGDSSLYDYDAGSFGFTKGDLSKARSKSAVPLGAGPYRFDKYKNKIAYLNSNENFYLGSPKIKRIEYRTFSDEGMVTGMLEGKVDIADPSASDITLQQIEANNESGELAGETLYAELISGAACGYIGIDPRNVCVGGDPASDASKNLRRAIATMLSVYRDVTVASYFGENAQIADYDLSGAGGYSYREAEEPEGGYEAALGTALGYFRAAGYMIANGMLTAAPEGAKLEYTAYVNGDGKGNHPCYGILLSASEALSSVGFTLTIKDINDAKEMWDAVSGGTAEIWCEEHKSNSYASFPYFVADSVTEIPVYLCSDLFVFAPEKVSLDTVPANQTVFYNYKNELYNLELK